MSQHTPGPWKFFDREDPAHALITDESGKSGIAVPIVHIRGINQHLTEMRANARLIAQAPALLDVCQEVESKLSRIVDTREGWTTDLVYCVRRLREEIAKAEGKS